MPGRQFVNKKSSYSENLFVHDLVFFLDAYVPHAYDPDMPFGPGEQIMAHATQMSASDTGLLVIDIQIKLIAKIPGAARLVHNVSFLLDVARLLEVPTLATEQYPRGLGNTVPELAPRLPSPPEKVRFSSCAVPAVIETLHREARPRVVLCGIETHVCVLNTALDLLAHDFRVYLAVDALGSRGAVDHDTALRRLEQAGAILTTVEGCAFEWIGGADHPQFKAISRLVQDRMAALPV